MIVSVIADPDRLNENIPFCGVTTIHFAEGAVLNHENHERKGFNSLRIVDSDYRYGDSDNHCRPQLPDLHGPETVEWGGQNGHVGPHGRKDEGDQSEPKSKGFL